MLSGCFLVVHNPVRKTANQSASFQPRDDHEPNTYVFKPIRVPSFDHMTMTGDMFKQASSKWKLLEKGNKTRLKGKVEDSPPKVDEQRWQFPASFLLTPGSIEAFLKQSPR